MRRFIVIGHDAPVDPDFPLADLPGAAGRLDVLCRCVTAALLRSHGIRTDTEIVTIHGDRIAIHFAGDAVRNLNPDERSTAARFRNALKAAEYAVGDVEVDASPGISVARRDLPAVLKTVDGPIVQLHPEGDPVTDLPPDADATFVLSDHRPFASADDDALADIVDRRASLGRVALHADQAITVVHNYLDTEGYRSY